MHGANVTVGGDVRAGQPHGPEHGGVTPVGVGFTGFKVVADDFTHSPVPITPHRRDSISTGALDLELHTGDLDLTGKHINADVIRLAATDGQGTQHNVTPAKVDFDGVTFAGSNGRARCGVHARAGRLDRLDAGRHRDPRPRALRGRREARRAVHDGPRLLRRRRGARPRRRREGERLNLLLAANGRSRETTPPIRSRATI